MASEDDLCELRGMSHKAVIAYVDAYAFAKRKSRMWVVNQVLLQFAREQAHLATVMANTTRGNPSLPDTTWGEVDG